MAASDVAGTAIVRAKGRAKKEAELTEHLMNIMVLESPYR